MIWKAIRWTLIGIVALGIGIAAAGYGLLHLPQLEGARSQIAAALLETYLGEAVDVTGSVTVSLEQTLDVDVQGVVPIAETGQTSPPAGSVRMSFARDAVWQGRLELVGLGLAHIRVIVDAAEKSSGREGLGDSVARAVRNTLSSPLLRNLEVDDLRIVRENDPTGWNGTLLFDRITARPADGAGSIAVEALGSLNENAFNISGSVPDLNAASDQGHDDAVALMLSVKGLEAELDGRLTESDTGLALAATLALRSPSLGDLQELLMLAREAEGTGALELALDGPLERLAVQSTTLRIEGAAGRVFSAEGTAADLWTFGGLDLRFEAALDPDGAASERSRLDIAPRSIQGRIASRARGFEIEDLHIETGLAAVELHTIGPMRIGTIGRDAQGRLRLEDIRLVQGNPKDPALDLTAQLDDAIALKGFSIKGRFGLQLGPLLTGQRGAAKVGTLRGEVAASDRTGEVRLEVLDGTLDGTDLMSLSLRLKDPGKSGTGPDIAVKLGVDDLDRLASAIGRAASPGVQVAFDGTIGAAEGEARIAGSARVGKTELAGHLAATAAGGKPRITGSLRAKDLHLNDLISAKELTVLAPAPAEDPVQLRQDVKKAVTVSIDLAAERIEGDRGEAGGLTAHVAYARSRVQFSSLKLAYLGGQIKADATADLAPSPPALTLNATVRRLSLERLFKRFDEPPFASGPLDLDLSVTANGATPEAILASLDGQISADLRDGRFADRTIDLAGQNIIAWAFSRGPDGGAPILCLVASFDFQNGVGRARELVFETKKVQVVGRGTLNLKADTLDLEFTPRAKLNDLIGKVRQVDVTGPMDNPKVRLADGAIGAKLVGDTVGLPFHLLGSIIGADGRLAPDHRPCVVAAE